MLFKNENQLTEFQKFLFNNPLDNMLEVKEEYMMGFISNHECLCQLLDKFLIAYSGLTLEDLADKLPAELFSEVYKIFESLQLNETYVI